MTIDLVQRSLEWKVARCGSLGASQIGDALAKTKQGWGASRANLIAELVVERLTGEPTKGFVSPQMQWGIDTEDQARRAYEFYQDAEVVLVGLIRHPTIENSHASPDGLVDQNGLVEIKCPSSGTHIETILGGAIPNRYGLQMMWQMACTGRAWCDFVSFDPRMPEDMQMHIVRVHRNDTWIADLEDEVRVFLAEVDAKVMALRNRQSPREVLREQLKASVA